MKTYKYILVILFSVFLFAACEKETEGVSRITYYCDLDLKGDPIAFVVVGNTYNEPGWEASENGVDVSNNVVVTGTVNTNVAGVYTIQYSAANSDGFSVLKKRTVAVVAAVPTVDRSGAYGLVHASRTGTITITKNGGVVGYYRASNSWWQAYAIPLDFVDMGDGKLIILSGSSPYGGHYGTGAILPDNQLRFDVILTDQGPMSYTTTYQLQ